MAKQRITISPITRLEGHGRIELFLDSKGSLENAYFQVPELRGFERFCVGRLAEDMPALTSRICGVCPEAHHLCSTKALDKLFKVEPTRVAKKLRELFYSAYYIYDHILHFYILASPDFVVGLDAKPEERNILGVIKKVGLEVAKEVIKHRAYGQRVLEILGGKTIHPTFGLPGGVSKGLNEEERAEIEKIASSSIEFAKFSIALWKDKLLPAYKELILNDGYKLETYYMGLVDESNKINFYDGKIRVVSPDNKEYAKFEVDNYLEHIAERVEPWSYCKFPYLKKLGWKGLEASKDSGIYRVGPLARVNASEGFATKLANEEYKKFYEFFNCKPVHNTLAYHWARLIEILYAAERLLELTQDKEITGKEIRTYPKSEEKESEGIGVIEAARGTLIHHYVADENKLIKKVNLIVATTHNHAPISISIKEAAKSLIKEGKVDKGILNKIEVAFRAYDPCFACATHFLPGHMPLAVNIYNANKKLIRKIANF